MVGTYLLTEGFVPVKGIFEPGHKTYHHQDIALGVVLPLSADRHITL